MALVINSNVASLATQRALSETQKDSAVSLERLSTGLRINSAKDDAAGMAISNRLSAQINGLSAAMRNANDGISLVQTAESAMGQITDNLQRMRELAVQSANGTNQASDRTALNTEFTSLRDEIERLADSTSFNGVNLLNGPAAINIQVGADSVDTDTTNRVSIAQTALIDTQTATLGTGGTSVGGVVSQDLTIASANVADIDATDLTINGTAMEAVAGATGTGNFALAVANTIMAADSDITATVGAATFDTGDYTAITNASTTTDYNLNINGVEITAVGTSAVTAAEMQAAVVSKESELAALGITFTGTTAGTVALGTNLVFSRADGGNIQFQEITAAAGTDAQGFSNGDTTLSGTGTTNTMSVGTISLVSDFGIVVGIGTGANNADALKIGAASGGASYTAATNTSTALASVSLTTEANAQTALTSVDTALDSINAARAELGATFTRLDAVSSNLSSTIENYTAANSRLQDADFAVESANLARTQVLQQAGISVLAQANALPQQVLALLQ